MNPRQMMIQSVAKKMMGRMGKRRPQMRPGPAQLGQPMKAPNSVMGFDPLMPRRMRKTPGQLPGGGY